MKKLIAILGSTFILVIFTSLPCWADPCWGDFNCDGDVDGSDLAIFAADFGRTDCVSNIPKVIGSVSFNDLGEVDLRSLQLALHYEVDAGGRTEFNDFKILIAADYELTPRLNLMAAKAEVLPEVIIFFWDELLKKVELLKLRSVFITSIKYLPPVTSGDPFLLDISLNFGKIFFDWAGRRVDWDLALNEGDRCDHQNIFHFVNLIDYAGTNVFPDYYIPISAFSFAMAHDTLIRPPLAFEAFEIKSAVSDVSLCLFSKVASQDNFDEVTIEKWGATFEKNPEARIKLEDGFVTTFSIYSTSVGDLEQKTSFSYNKIWWTHWGFREPGVPEEWTTGWNVEANIPLD